MRSLLWIVKCDTKQKNDVQHQAEELLDSPKGWNSVVVFVKNETGDELRQLIEKEVGKRKDFGMIAISGGHGLPRGKNLKFAGFSGSDVDEVFDTLTDLGVKAYVVMAPTCYSASYVERLKPLAKQEGVIVTSTTTSGYKFTDEIAAFASRDLDTFSIELGQFEYFTIHNPARLTVEEYKQLQICLAKNPVELHEIININARKMNEFVGKTQLLLAKPSSLQLYQSVIKDMHSFPIEGLNGHLYHNGEELTHALILKYREITCNYEILSTELMEKSPSDWPDMDIDGFNYSVSDLGLKLGTGSGVEDKDAIKEIVDIYKDRHVTSTCVTTHQGSFTRLFDIDKDQNLSPTPIGALRDGGREKKYHQMTISNLTDLIEVDHSDYDALQDKFNDAMLHIASARKRDLIRVASIPTVHLAEGERRKAIIEHENLHEQMTLVKTELRALKNKGNLADNTESGTLISTKNSG